MATEAIHQERRSPPPDRSDGGGVPPGPPGTPGTPEARRGILPLPRFRNVPGELGGARPPTPSLVWGATRPRRTNTMHALVFLNAGDNQVTGRRGPEDPEGSAAPGTGPTCGGPGSDVPHLLRELDDLGSKQVFVGRVIL